MNMNTPGLVGTAIFLDVVTSSAAPISGPFDALIDGGITFNASIKKPKFGMPKKG